MSARPGPSLRAHVASLVAVFLALAIGVLVGGEVLHATVVHDLRTQAGVAHDDAADARRTAEADRAARSRAESFSAAAGPRLLAGVLPGATVLLVSIPGTAADDRNRLAAGLRTAGASLVGDVRLGPVATDPDASALLTDVASRLRPATVTVHTEPGQQLADVVAAASTTGGATGGTSGDGARLVPTLRGARLLEPGSRVDARADLVVLLVPGGVARGSQIALLLDLARSCSARAAAVIVAGPAGSAAAGGVLAALRRDPLQTSVSSADGIDTAEGPTVATLALAERRGGRAGHYGTGPGATAVLPPTPTPRATAPAGAVPSGSATPPATVVGGAPPP